jgi:diguanylate cyclase (GGDEF)-like protein
MKLPGLLGAALGGSAAGGLLALCAYAAAQMGMLGWVLLATIFVAIGALVAVSLLRWRTLSLIDDATGLPTRRYLFGRLQRELRLNRTDSLAFIVFEIDDMKRVNDTFGHLAGDQLLATIAATARDHVRSSDTVVRWGGDEFGIILPRTDVAHALIMAERIRLHIAELAIDVGSDRPAHTTISVGVATNLDHDRTTDLIDRADRAMYLAKQRKNRVILAGAG